MSRAEFNNQLYFQLYVIRPLVTYAIYKIIMLWLRKQGGR
jgi:hypothetical protein